MRGLKFAAAFAAVYLAATVSYGQIINGETPIFTRLVPGQDLAFWSPNVFSPIHPKVLSLTGTISGQPNPTGPAALAVRFDWLDLQGNQVFSDPVVVQIPPGTASVPLDLTHTLNFCPERVSVHFRSANGTVTVDSLFKHECLIPEPATGLMGLLGMGGLALARRRQAS